MGLKAQPVPRDLQDPKGFQELPAPKALKGPRVFKEFKVHREFKDRPVLLEQLDRPGRMVPRATQVLPDLKVILGKSALLVPPALLELDLKVPLVLPDLPVLLVLLVLAPAAELLALLDRKVPLALQDLLVLLDL